MLIKVIRYYIVLYIQKKTSSDGAWSPIFRAFENLLVVSGLGWVLESYDLCLVAVVADAAARTAV